MSANRAGAANPKDRLRRVEQQFSLRLVALYRMPNLVGEVLLVDVAKKSGEQHEERTLKCVPRDDDFARVARMKSNRLAMDL